MKKPRLPKPTQGELEILQILWRKGPSTVRAIHDGISTYKEVGYTTSLKLMQIMFEKGLLRRHKSGRTHIYEAMIQEEEIQLQLLDKLLNTAFHGSAMKLVMQALGNRTSTPEELDQIREFLDKLEGNQQ